MRDRELCQHFGRKLRKKADSLSGMQFVKMEAKAVRKRNEIPCGIVKAISVEVIPASRLARHYATKAAEKLIAKMIFEHRREIEIQ
jgi:hypothetical protein